MPSITLYYAEWCGHCQNFKPEWNRLKEIAKNNSKYSNIKINEYEQGENPEIMQKAGVKGYPTIRINGKNYNGKRDANEILEASLSGQSGGGYDKDDEYYKSKYLKYKAKYFKLKAELNY